MSDQLRMGTMLDRIKACLAYEEHMKTGVRMEAAVPLHYLLQTGGDMERGAFKDLKGGLGERTAPSVLSALLSRELLTTDSVRGKLRFGVPLHALSTFRRCGPKPRQRPKRPGPERRGARSAPYWVARTTSPYRTRPTSLVSQPATWPMEVASSHPTPYLLNARERRTNVLDQMKMLDIHPAAPPNKVPDHRAHRQSNAYSSGSRVSKKTAAIQAVRVAPAVDAGARIRPNDSEEL